MTYSDTFTDILPIVYTGFNTLSRLIFLYVTVTPVVQVTYSDTFTDILPIVYTGFNTLSLSSHRSFCYSYTSSTGDIQ